MKRVFSSRLTAVVYITAATFGLIISLGSLLVLWINKQDTTQRLAGTVALFGRTLDATNQTVTVAGTTLDQAGSDLDSLHTMIGNLSSTLNDSQGMIQSTADLIGGNMVDFVTNTQDSLASVQSSAKLVDDFLHLLNSVPFLGGRYQPKVPLQESVARVSRSMDPLPGSFRKIRGDLDKASASAATLRSEVEAMGKQVEDIQNSLSEAKGILVEYRGILSDVQERYNGFQARLPVMINVFYLLATLVLLWILMTQVGMLLHGLEMLS